MAQRYLRANLLAWSRGMMVTIGTIRRMVIFELKFNQSSGIYLLGSTDIDWENMIFHSQDWWYFLLNINLTINERLSQFPSSHSFPDSERTCPNALGLEWIADRSGKSDCWIWINGFERILNKIEWLKSSHYTNDESVRFIEGISISANSEAPIRSGFHCDQSGTALSSLE
jgi:hypothetical protein